MSQPQSDMMRTCRRGHFRTILWTRRRSSVSASPLLVRHASAQSSVLRILIVFVADANETIPSFSCCSIRHKQPQATANTSNFTLLPPPSRSTNFACQICTRSTILHDVAALSITWRSIPPPFV
eukprot:1599227-Rhodomonas_salina.1